MKKIFFILIMAFICNNCQSQTLKGKVYYDVGGSKRKSAIGLTIYLIPDNTKNAAIVNSSAKWEPSCNEKLLSSAQNHKMTITDKEGYYHFNDISAGSYLIKVCKKSGGYYKFKISVAFKGTLSLPDLEADPPIK
jgi:hypothetical protein